MNWNTIANNQTLAKTVEALKANGVNTIVVDTIADAKTKALEMLPKGAEVMTMTSETLRISEIEKEVNESGNYNAVKPKLFAMDRATQGAEMQKLGAAPEYAIGSVHAVTEEGQVIVASNTGSQLPGYVYGSSHVVWVVGAQKIVKNIDEGLKRIYDYVLPLEAERARKAYGVAGSNVSKLFILNKEVNPDRIQMILIKEQIGY